LTIVKMTGFLFGLISNSCMTGHKLQGCVAQELFVNEWACHSNWSCVVSSGVTTMLGPHFRNRLSKDLSLCAMPEEMKRMLARFREAIGIKDLSDDGCEQLLQWEVDRMSRMGWKPQAMIESKKKRKCHPKS